MAKKKVTKKAVKTIAPMKAAPMKSTSMKAAPETCATSETCYCKPILALLIIVLAWWKPAVMWSQITITIAAAIIFLSGNSCYCKK